MISEKAFVNKYHRPKETFSQFLKSYKVNMRGQISSLSSYAKRKNISTQQLVKPIYHTKVSIAVFGVQIKRDSYY